MPLKSAAVSGVGSGLSSVSQPMAVSESVKMAAGPVESHSARAVTSISVSA